MHSQTKRLIKAILKDCINRTIKRLSVDTTHRPFHEALLTKKLVISAAFERSFSTSFGQGPIEQISEIIASGAGAECKRQKETMANVYKGAIDEIERITSALRSGDKKPNWDAEIKKILAHKKGDTEVRRVISDLWIKKDDEEIFISIKTVKPNLDQTEIAKKDLLLLKAHNNQFKAYFGLFYNPGGNKRDDYNWSIPSKIFNMKEDDCVLIGKDYWNLLGGEGTYNKLLSIFKEVGKETQKKLLQLYS